MKNWFRTQGQPLWSKYAPLAGLMIAGLIAGLIGAAFVNYGVGTPAFWDVAAQPMATLSTGLLAIGAATIAFIGVRNAQKIAINSQKQQADEHRDQIALQNNAQINQARQHQAQLEAIENVERSKHRREATFNALVSANTALVELNAAFVLIDKAVVEDQEREGVGTPAENAARAQCEIRLSACTNAASLLLVLGIEDSYMAIMNTTKIVREHMAFRQGQEIDIAGIHKFAEAFTLAIGSLRGKYDADIGGTAA
nr:MAG TPA: hypothetical protein [Caudoviricetes sp.]